MENETAYTCRSGYSLTCPETCVGLDACEGCQCAVVDTEGGPWGNAMDVIMCLLPIAFLLGATLKPNPLPTTFSLPTAALLMFLVRLMYLGSDPLLVCSAIVSGLHEALSPLTIMGGAIFLFETMESTLCMPYMMREMKALTEGQPVAELMLLFCFAYMVEGASGFGTPVALGAPMLVSLGYPKFESVVTLLLMNTFATVWGAAGTPIWFGFGNLGLSDDDFIEISYKAGVALALSAFLLLPLVLRISCSWQQLWENKLFLLLSLTSVVGPALALSFVAYEFPSLIGGMIGWVLTAILISFNVGLNEVAHIEDETGRHPLDIHSTSTKHSVILQHLHFKKQLSVEEESTVFTWKPDDSPDKTSPDDSEMSAPKNSNGESLPPETATEPVAENGTDMQWTEEKKNDEDEAAEEDLEKQGEKTAMKSSVSFDEKASMRDSHQAIELALGPRKGFGEGFLKEITLRTFPLWGTVLLLILTRIPQIGLRSLLNRTEPGFAIYFGTYGTFRCSAALVLQLQNILTYPNLNWTYAALYIPFLVPFVLISLITMIIFRKDLQRRPRAIAGVVVDRLTNPAIALGGALVLVQLMIKEGPASPASIIGDVLASAFGAGWLAIAALIGALGSFFSGSTTISNLTFGEVQYIVAEDIGISPTALLAIQAAGASAGNGVCLNNIIAACAVVGLHVGEGKIIGQTFKIVFGICVIVTLVILAFFIRF